MIKRLSTYLMPYLIVIGLLIPVNFILAYGFGDKASGSKPPDHLAWMLRQGFSSVDRPLYNAGSILKAKEKLKLTEKQEQKIETIMMSYQEFSIRKSAEIKIRELRFASYVRSDSIGKKEMADHIREISELKTDWVVAYINHLLDLKAVLNTEQLDILKTLRRRTSTTNRKRNGYSSKSQKKYGSGQKQE